MIDLLVAGLSKRLKEKHLTIEITPAAKEYFFVHGYDPAFGELENRRMS